MTEAIVKVLLRTDNVKYLIVPKKSKINAGEYVVVSNNLNMIEKIQKEEKDGGRKRS
jgi:hypothetical protein